VANASEIVRAARALQPEIRVIARANYLSARKSLRDAGADEVFSGEGEVAVAMTGAILEQLGASPEQMDRERQRVRQDLFGEATGPTEQNPLTPTLPTHEVTPEG